MPLLAPVSVGSPAAVVNEGQQQQQQQLVRCCTPRACLQPTALIDLRHPEDAVRVVCNNDQCNCGTLMHRACFEEWEQAIVVFLRSCGRAHGWSEKQRVQNLWTKRGHDMTFKACDCLCGKGHLRKDLGSQSQQSTQPQEQPEDKNRKKNRKKPERPSVVILAAPATHQRGQLPVSLARSMARSLGGVASAAIAAQPLPGSGGGGGGRPHASSFSSTGSSPPRSCSPPQSSADDEPSGGASAAAATTATLSSPASAGRRSRKFSFSSSVGDGKQAYAVTGNIFFHRENLSVFNCLPLHKRNGYHIKMEDEGPFVNDETRCFVLSNLSAHKASTVQCVVCLGSLVVYDRYPLIDGTFFVTPVRHQGAASIVVAAVPSGGGAAAGGGTSGEQQPPQSSHAAPPSGSKQQYMAAVCMHCLLGWTALRCRGCRRRWDGSALVLGTMYAYDVFAAQPCCQRRLLCRACRRPVVDPARLPPYYSEYSRPVACQHCRSVAEHYVQNISEAFYLA